MACPLSSSATTRTRIHQRDGKSKGNSATFYDIVPMTSSMTIATQEVESGSLEDRSHGACSGELISECFRRRKLWKIGGSVCESNSR
jgi:hypothetical protein